MALAASRFLLMPDGAWEQDEAIFAAGVHDYSIAAHRPHPPGFPGWITLGKLLHPVVGDALLALRIWSCLASLLTFLLVAALLRPIVATASTATAGALLYSLVPTVWFHAPRAFSTTPALATALAALWLWQRTPSRAGTIAGWLLWAAAGTIRPQLLPLLAILALWGAKSQRSRPRHLAAGISLAALLGLLVFWVMVVDTGSLSALFKISRSHLYRSLAASSWPAITELGALRGLGGVFGGSLWITAFAFGTVLMILRHRELGLWILAAVGLSTYSILALHPPSFPRYSILLALVTLPAVTSALDAIASHRRRAATLILLVSIFGTRAAPALWAAHTTPLPVVAALRSLVDSQIKAELLYSDGLVPFVRLETMEGRLSRTATSLSLLRNNKKSLDDPFVLLASDEDWLAGATVSVRDFTGFPASAWDLSQRRFDTAHILQNPVVPLRGTTRWVETNSRDEPYLWLFNEVEIIHQPGASHLVLILDVDRHRGPLQLMARSAGNDLLDRELPTGTHRVRIPVQHANGRVQLSLSSSAKTTRPTRTARLYGAWNEDPIFRRHQTFKASPGRPLAALAQGVEFSGVYAPEVFRTRKLPGAWTDGRMQIRFPAGDGTLDLHLAMPPPRTGIVELENDGVRRADIAGSSPTHHRLRVRSHEGVVDVTLYGETRRPDDTHPKSRDRRSLGPIFFDLVFTPESPSVPQG